MTTVAGSGSGAAGRYRARVAERPRHHRRPPGRAPLRGPAPAPGDRAHGAVRPQVVILDEATSALDAETEAKLHDALREFLKNRTTLIIAHRLSAVKQADRAYVFDDGHIIEEGVHES